MSWANQRIASHDGLRLAMDVHLPPESTWPVPAVVTRTAYGRGVHLAEGRAWRAAGVAFVAQDVRGRYDSDGVWTPYRGERADGAALVDHLLGQPWCDGRIIAYGGSYSGYTAWTMAVERPEAVVGVISLGASLGLHRTKFTPNGILRLSEHIGWWLERADGRTSRAGLRETVLGEDPELLSTLPVADIGARTGVQLPHLDDAIALHETHGYDGDPPEAVTPRELASLTCATLHAGGWYDLLAPEVLQLWARAGAKVCPRPPRELVLGPWGHDLGMAGSTSTGVLEHGTASQLRWGAELVSWVRQVLLRTASSRARVFRVGTGTWVTTEEWPPARAGRRWYAGDGGVLTPEPTAPAAVPFQYDPLDPFPSYLPGHDRRATLARSDAARFRTDPLPADLVIDGVPTVDLSASTTAEGTDWIVRLAHHDLDGRLIELATGAATAPRTGVGQHRTELTPLSVRLPAGSRLMLEITSSDVPHLARHLGTGPDRLRSSCTVVGSQTIHAGPGTAITLPVAPQLPPARPPREPQ
ncbi:CocE/NonD family hydrolase [Actinotalea sp. C106]|uniref:CocE/NonD family hydrolase n=1 Tax=Actinotalea sp. C106 TaxID=2908644 RepID=UPI002027A4F1|nr:CocE/NonD family hydrolase [Actinotalea sp. C106]